MLFTPFMQELAERWLVTRQVSKAHFQVLIQWQLEASTAFQMRLMRHPTFDVLEKDYWSVHSSWPNCLQLTQTCLLMSAIM